MPCGKFGRQMQGHFQIVIRSGCYVTHDHGQCAQKLAAAQERGPEADLPMFRPALELWSHVQSKPEEGLALLNFGKRDCSYDIALPIPLFAQTLSSGKQRVDLTQCKRGQLQRSACLSERPWHRAIAGRRSGLLRDIASLYRFR